MEQRKSSGIGVQEEYLTFGQDSRWQWLVVCAVEPFRRRKRYNEISPTKKEELLLQRRTRELDSRRRLAQICAPNYSTTSTSSASNSTFQQNRLLIIRDVCVTATQDSTSHTPNGQCDLGSENLIDRDNFLDMEAQMLEQQKKKRNIVSCREYYCYKIQMRNDENDELLHTRRAFQQYIVDMFIKLETQRLDFFFFNPELFRMKVLQGLLDVLGHGERDAAKIGKQTFLPVTFTGGPRDMRQRYLDAITLVQRFGKPDLFLTMTCNPTWSKIKEHLLPTDETQNRPDLISRVFRAKVEELKTDILKRNVFGKITTVDEAKRFYPLFGLAENVVLIFSGQTVKYFASLRSSLAPGIKRDGITKLVVLPLYPQYSISTARSTVRALQNVSNILINASESKLHAQDLEFQQIALGQCSLMFFLTNLLDTKRQLYPLWLLLITVTECTLHVNLGWCDKVGDEGVMSLAYGVLISEPWLSPYNRDIDARYCLLGYVNKSGNISEQQKLQILYRLMLSFVVSDLFLLLNILFFFTLLISSSDQGVSIAVSNLQKRIVATKYRSDVTEDSTTAPGHPPRQAAKGENNIQTLGSPHSQKVSTRWSPGEAYRPTLQEVHVYVYAFEIGYNVLTFELKNSNS
ncbi:hypothetical protein FXO38_06544 [Capsicum annuum]|nr:hypothetical protein FXO38_06544 [Capsicum annuum]KAF3673959.1 hypothetical protein FXO37_06676 [Capsicum annuum]